MRPSTARKLAWLGKIPDRELANRFARSIRSVYQKRFLSQIPPFRGDRPPKRPRRPWTPAEDKLLGTESDDRIAKILNRHQVMICQRRAAPHVALFAFDSPCPFAYHVKITSDTARRVSAT